MLTSIYIKTQFVGFHRWKDAPEKVAFLRDFHRHVFWVVCHFYVSHGDRELEFFIVKEKLENYLAHTFENQRFEKSCEMIAETILLELRKQGLDCHKVDVSEDNENGATVSLHQ